MRLNALSFVQSGIKSPMKFHLQKSVAFFCPIVFASIVGGAQAAPFYDASPFGAGGALQCINGECEAVIAKTTYQNRPAYKLTNGAVDAIVVPEIGRVMSFGKVGGPNLLWNAEPSQLAKTGWKNYGGDKMWLSPQSDWKLFHGANNWPPEAVFDGEPLKADVLTGGKLQLTSGISKTGIRVVRTLYFDDNGEFVIEQTARKESGAPLKAGLWSITQVVPGQAVFVAVNPDTQYQGGFYRFDNKRVQSAALMKPNLLRLQTQPNGKSGKFGFDAPVAAIASVSDGVALVQKAARPDGQYPDGADGAGFPTELYVNADPNNFYQELEILGPLQEFHVGTSWTHTVRWSLHALPSADVDAPAVIEAMEKLLLPAEKGDANG